MTIKEGDQLRVMKRLSDYIRQHGIRRSDSRDAVFGLLLEADDHLELPELINRAKRRKVGEATVYRALKLFQDAGLVSRIEKTGGHTYYEVSRVHHDHMICRPCGAVIEFHSPLIERTQDEIARRHGFEVRSHRHEIYGICKECRNRRKRT